MNEQEKKINNQINKLANQLFGKNPEAMKRYNQESLLNRVGMIGIIAAMGEEHIIANNCNEWMKIINA